MADLVTLRILVAANAGPMREALHDIAAQAAVPLEFAEAGDGTKAAGLIGGKTFDLVLLDAAWGEHDLERAASACRASTPPPFVVALSDPNEDVDRRFADARARKPANAADAHRLIGGCVRALMPLTVLIVDDSAATRGLVRKILCATRFRVEVLEAADGAVAFAHVKNNPVDIVLLDYNMPGIDGFATLKVLKLEKPALRVVIMTAQQDAELSGRARAAGADGFLHKPFYPADVDDVLHRLFGLRRL